MSGVLKQERLYFYIGEDIMAKGINQKLKLLYIAQILEQKTDEEHPISTQKLIEELAKHEISAERKSIYDDINQLIDFGYDIVVSKSRTNGGYYLASRHFELTELKLLVDTVQASRFITLKKSRELIGKLNSMVSVNEEAQLKRDVFVQNRIKTDNESIYYVVNDIYHAIQNNKMISFMYMEWNSKKELAPRHGGKRYEISPFALTIKDENYYLIAFDSDAGKIKHYRVDKIKEIRLEEKKREGIEMFERFDVATYTNRSFGMFGGVDETVTLRFPEKSIGIVIDRFGTDIDIRNGGDGMMLARVMVTVSNQFFGWITSLGGDVLIDAPTNVRQEYVDYLSKITNNY